MERAEEIWRQLETVVDPELDESVTDMGFISRVDVDASDCVHIDFRLPTYWCAANFAFMMADDMRTAVRELAWVKDTKIVLGDHMYADAINRGVGEGLSFQETFGEEANGDLDELRRTFLLKAFQRRQEALINHLLQLGLSAAEIVTLQISALQELDLGVDGQRLVARYLARRNVPGPFTKATPAFVSGEGHPLDGEQLGIYLTALRRVRANAEFNGALCRGLLEVRFDTTTPLSRKAGEGCTAHGSVTPQQ